MPKTSDLKTPLLSIVERFAGRRVLVVGDLIADEFIYGAVNRVSREAPVLILKYDATEIVAGGAGNAANNVAALGGRARLAGIVGADPEGRRLLSSFPRAVDCRQVVRAPHYRTPIKTRILAGGIHSAKQQVVRIDREPDWPLSEDVARAFLKAMGKRIDDCDAVLLSDYGSGLVTPTLAGHLRHALASRRSARPIPVLLDSRYRMVDYRGLTACTPNESEVEQLLGIHIDDDLVVLERAGRTLLKRTASEALLITRGSRGMALFQPQQPTVHIPIHGSDEVANVTGAGDTVIATMTLALAAGASFEDAARLANYAGGLVVMKRGTATVSARELVDAIEDVKDQGPRTDQGRTKDQGRPKAQGPRTKD